MQIAFWHENLAFCRTALATYDRTHENFSLYLIRFIVIYILNPGNRLCRPHSLFIEHCNIWNWLGKWKWFRDRHRNWSRNRSGKRKRVRIWDRYWDWRLRRGLGNRFWKRLRQRFRFWKRHRLWQWQRLK